MLTNPTALHNGTIAVSFDYRGGTLNQSQYSDAAATLNLPHVLDVSHRDNGSGESVTRNSRYGFRRTVEDGSGNQGVIKVDLVISIPKRIATSTQVTEQVTLMKDFLTETGYIAKIVAGEV